MRPRSIRWQLPISYAAIALLSTLALGVFLLITLRSYYEQREIDYLTGNADAIKSAVVNMIHDDVPSAVIESHIASYSFLSQVRIRLYDVNGEVVADSGVPDVQNRLSISAQPNQSSDDTQSDREQQLDFFYFLAPEDYIDLQRFRTSIEMPIGISIENRERGGETGYYTPVITLDFVPSVPDSPLDFVSPPVTTEDIDYTDYTYDFPATGTIFGFGFSEDISTQRIELSNQSVSETLLGADGEVIGSLDFSDGPAYGRLIVNRVASGWALASIVAIGIAATAGYSVSRRITVPLSSLTEVTTAMAKGDLSARSDLQREDELGLLAQTFNEMAQRVETTVLTLRRFVADAAHEIHTPITALQTNLELAIDEENWGIRQGYIKRAGTQLKRLEKLTDGLLDLSRIEAGLSVSPHKPISLNKVVQELSEIYASRSEQAAVNFDLSLPQQSVTIHGNEQQLRSALRNLMDNAIKFTPAGGTVSVEVINENDWVKVNIQDCGIGIPSDEMSLIFSRFHRGRNAIDHYGSGLGLAIVRGVVDSHHGEITVKNMNPGARFSIMLPLPG